MELANQLQFTTPANAVVVVVENSEEHVDLIRVEKSLHSLGFFASTTSDRELSRTILQSIRRPDGQKIQARAVIEGIKSLGLPTTADRDKYMAFMKIALDNRGNDGKVVNPVRFTGSDMIKLLGLRKGGFHYDEINDWCKRMVATTIMSESSIFLADRKTFATDTFHVFDRVVLIGEQVEDGVRSEYYQVYLSHWQLTNLNQGYMLPLDFSAYLKLRRDISKAIFGHLSIWFYASRGQTVEKRYLDLCQLLNIRAYPHISKARAVLNPSLEELIKIGYLSDAELTKTSTGGEFKLSLTPGKRLLALDHFANTMNPEVRATLEACLPDWVHQLSSRGVAERKARQLALDISEGQPVQDQIEYADYLIQQNSPGRKKISNPAGFFIWVVENNLAVPEAFETTRKRQLREAREQAENEQSYRFLQLQEDYATFCNEQVHKALDAIYTPEQMDAALREQLKIIRREQPWLERVPEFTQRDIALGRLKIAMREKLNLPGFESWSKLDLQQRLF